MVKVTGFVTSALALLVLVSAHPGEQHHEALGPEIAHRQRFLSESKQSLAACATATNGRKLMEQASMQRAAKIRQLEAQRRLTAATVIDTTHKSSVTGITSTTDPATLFASNTSCVLEPEVTEGPYYVKGELIREDIRETQKGIDLYTSLQFIDVNTCEPVDKLYVDFWHCNATGVYSGVIASGNGNSSDKTLVNQTFNRGLYPTDTSGIVTFITHFPGHYTGRTSHIHIMGSYNGTLLSNKTYVGGVAAHVGQIFFDQDLITKVEKTEVYAVNTQTVTKNANDKIFAQAAASGFDPVLQYVLLGDSVEDGIFSWITVGVDMKNAKTVAAAATLTANGGVMSATNMRGKPPGPMDDSEDSHSGDDDNDDDDETSGAQIFVVAFFIYTAPSALLAFILSLL